MKIIDHIRKQMQKLMLISSTKKINIKLQVYSIKLILMSNVDILYKYLSETIDIFYGIVK